MTSRLRLAVFALVAPVAVAAGTAVTAPIAGADTPAAGDACTALHATTKDANGRTMWCNPTMTDAHNLVWQYGGPA